MRLLLEARRRELRAMGCELAPPTRPVERPPLRLDSCPDYLDARDCLCELSASPLTLETQTACRRLRVLVDRLAVDVARATLGK